LACQQSTEIHNNSPGSKASSQLEISLRDVKGSLWDNFKTMKLLLSAQSDEGLHWVAQAVHRNHQLPVVHVDHTNNISEEIFCNDEVKAIDWVERRAVQQRRLIVDVSSKQNLGGKSVMR